MPLYILEHSHAIHNKATSHSACETLSNIGYPTCNQTSFDVGADYDLVEATDPKKQ